jgi:hypothetical protein
MTAEPLYQESRALVWPEPMSNATRPSLWPVVHSERDV